MAAKEYPMSVQLHPEDCRAIDLLLDQGVRAGGVNNARSLTSSTSAVDRDRLVAVQRVLGLLAMMPAPEPPANLISKTLARIERAPSPAAHAPAPMMRYHRDQPSA
jgi:hypothetical protein